MISRRVVLVLAFCCLAPILMIVGRSEFEAHNAWDAAEAAQAQGDVEEYLYQLQRCAKWNTSLTDHSTTALQSLVSFAKTAKNEKRYGQALAAWRYARGSILATQHVLNTSSRSLDEMNRNIAWLMAHEQITSNAVTVNGRSRAELEAEHLALLNRRYGPRPWGAMVIIFTFLAWVGSLFWMIRYGVRPDGGVHRKPLIRGGLVSMALFSSFCGALFFF